MKFLYRHISLTIILSILLSSVGVALPRHICLMTGIVQETPTAKVTDCCQKKTVCTESEADLEKVSNENDSCCALSVEHEKLNPEASLKGFSLNFLALSPALLPVFPAYLFAPVAATQQEILTYSDSSPPLYGRSLLRKIQILIV